MSGSLDADGNLWDPKGNAMLRKIRQSDARIHQSLTEKKIRRLKVRAASGNPGKPEMKPGTGKSPSETQVDMWITLKAVTGSMCISAERWQAPGVYELSEDSRIYEAVDAAGGFTENAARESVNLASKSF